MLLAAAMLLASFGNGGSNVKLINAFDRTPQVRDAITRQRHAIVKETGSEVPNCAVVNPQRITELTILDEPFIAKESTEGVGNMLGSIRK